ncbi:hypothetical protein OVA24_00215 [Luteolibacter sp. SL250]|uniref:hypothetical protein n=1 Tax=Luteolibacter sp. SL250 TaxID=2995170 RepID=UPI00226DAF23|nr:hypothetical protein [Luteolibacter sp. SL250]WAC19800.1 hypothetical protein OVA24_00215 [Luteolibacter sp. SL250]
MNALKAWLKSLPLALGVPALCWLFFILSMGKPGIHVPYILGLVVGIHLITYLITGLPIFLIYHRRPGEMIWHPAVALTTGTILGGFGFILIFRTIGTEGLLIGAGHGFITAIAAWLQRPRHHENTHHLP